MTTDATLLIRLLMLASVAATLNVPPKPVLMKRLKEEAGQVLDEEEKRQLDHESFLGKDGAEMFDQLSIDDSRKGIGLIYDKIDKDRSGHVTEDEMTNWIKKIHKRQMELDADSYWSIYIGVSNAELLTWESFREATYGLDYDPKDTDETSANSVALRKSLRHYNRLWRNADKDGDGSLNKQESRDFFFPEESDALKDVVVDETMEELDENNDGYISQEEYLSDSIAAENAADLHPDWFETERRLFVEVKDLDKDSRLSRDEVMQWLVPSNYDRFKAEAHRLIHQADLNQDGVLSKEEMTGNYDLFVGSQAMNFDKELEAHEEF